MNKVQKRSRLIGGVLAAGLLTLVAVAPGAERGAAAEGGHL